MAFTIQQIDQKISQAEATLAEATKKLEYWRNVRDVVNNPLFAELSSIPASVIMAPSYRIETGIPSPSPSQYGQLKRLTLECLPDKGEPVTPQKLAELIAATGFEFRTRTPAISVNDALNTLQKKGMVRFVGKSSSNAGLWLKQSTGLESEVKSQEPTEVGS